MIQDSAPAADTPLFQLGVFAFTVSVMCTADDIPAEELEDQAIAVGLDDEEIDALLSPEDDSDEDEDQSDTFGITLAVWASDPADAEVKAHTACQAVLDAQGYVWHVMRTAVVLVGHPEVINTPDAKTTWAEDVANSDEIAEAVEEVENDPLFPVDLGDG